MSLTPFLSCILLILGMFVFTVSAQESTDRSNCKFSKYKGPVLSDGIYSAIKKVNPSTVAARKAGATGKVDVRIVIEKSGKVIQACALNGDPLLYEISEQAALQWLFKKNMGFTYNRKRYYQTIITFSFVKRKISYSKSR